MFVDKQPPPPDQTEMTGYLGRLTPEQKVKLAELWEAMEEVMNREPVKADAPPAAQKKKGGMFGGLFGGQAAKKDVEWEINENGEKVFPGLDELLKGMNPKDLQRSFWDITTQDYPDTILLRFLRARKWDVQAALRMMLATQKFRMEEDVAGLIQQGDLGMEKHFKSTGEKGWRFQWESGKSFFLGTDKWNRPICYINVRLHFKKDQDDVPLRKFTLLVIETARQLLVPPVETSCLVFNMTGLSMANLDLGFLKYLIMCFEAYYPESLGLCIVHNAPWFFEPVWRVIRPWLDPVVASKIRFTNSTDDLLQYIPEKYLPKDVGGTSDFKWNYIPPVEGENDKHKDTATRDALLAKRRELENQFEERTREWVKAVKADDKDAADAAWAKREELNPQLRRAYYDLDPYVRGRNVYHRTGVLKPDFSVHWQA
ncbi:uncharacterized protein VTP21DRAFT_3727 [Calcarisporiella thermophila]|uniref:uncharacterized protein n=1 Tax=Calcarisporiella thermophila TaxID=911321 RepID=UPI0037423754